MSDTFYGRVVAASGDRFVVESAVPERRTFRGVARPGAILRFDKCIDNGDGTWSAARVENLGGTVGDFPHPRGDWARLHAGTRLATLRARADVMRRLRTFFDGRGFLEVDTPLVVPSPGLELHLDAFSVEDRWLITSPEYQMKRLLAGGLERIYTVCKCFRRREAGAQHNPEFTMAEWYRAPGTWQEIADDVEALVADAALGARAATAIEYRGATIELAPPWTRMTVAEAMERWARVRVDGDEPVEVLRERGLAAGWPVSGEAWDDVFFSIFLHALEPHLGLGRPTVLHDWPAPLCALARRKPSDGRVVERFEAYAGGLELCNGFGELVDETEQRARLEKDRAERARRGLPLYPVDEKFLAALAEGVPPSAGVALGVDRLVMLATGASELRQVVTFTDDEL